MWKVLFTMERWSLHCKIKVGSGIFLGKDSIVKHRCGLAPIL